MQARILAALWRTHGSAHGSARTVRGFEMLGLGAVVAAIAYASGGLVAAMVG